MGQRDDDKLVRQLSLVAFLMAQQRPVTAEEIHEAVEGYGGMSEQAFLRRFYADRAEIACKSRVPLVLVHTRASVTEPLKPPKAPIVPTLETTESADTPNS